VTEAQLTQILSQLSDLADRVQALETGRGSTSEVVPANDPGWRRQALALQHALGEVARVGDLYEEAWAAEDRARDLDGQAAKQRREAQQAFRRALAAHRAALHMLAAPVDAADLLDDSHRSAPEGKARDELGARPGPLAESPES
jgi:hypothetical protein